MTIQSPKEKEDPPSVDSCMGHWKATVVESRMQNLRKVVIVGGMDMFLVGIKKSGENLVREKPKN